MTMPPVPGVTLMDPFVMRIRIVPANQMIVCQRTGQYAYVTDNTPVMDGGIIYVTDKCWERIVAHPSVRPA